MQLFFVSLLFDVHMRLNVFQASPRPSTEVYDCTRSLWFYLWKETTEAGQTMTNNAPAVSFQR
jgi:hypothetical protein